MRGTPVVLTVLMALAIPGPSHAQFGLDKLKRKVSRTREIVDAVRPMTAREEQALGESVGHRLKSNYGVVDDDGLQRYVNLVGRRVGRVADPGVEHRVVVLECEFINAFSVPGGDIYVTRGLLASISSEAQLAGVLGHEIHHAVDRHAAKAVENSERWSTVGDLAMEDQSELFVALTDTATSAALSGYGRKEEKESDSHGVSAGGLAGYQPQGLVEFLAILKEDSEKAENKNRGGLLGSHPEIGYRIDVLQKQLEQQAAAGEARLAERYSAAVPFAAADRTLIALLPEGRTGEASSEPAQKKKKKKFGLGSLKGLGKSMAGDSDDDRSASGGVRGVGEVELGVGDVAYRDPVIEITADELAAFIEEGGLEL